MDLLSYGLRAEALVRPKTLQAGWPSSWETSCLGVIEADDESTDVEQEETSLGVWKESRAAAY